MIATAVCPPKCNNFLDYCLPVLNNWMFIHTACGALQHCATVYHNMLHSLTYAYCGTVTRDCNPRLVFLIPGLRNLKSQGSRWEYWILPRIWVGVLNKVRIFEVSVFNSELELNFTNLELESRLAVDRTQSTDQFSMCNRACTGCSGPAVSLT